MQHNNDSPHSQVMSRVDHLSDALFLSPSALFWICLQKWGKPFEHLAARSGALGGRGAFQRSWIYFFHIAAFQVSSFLSTFQESTWFNLWLCIGSDLNQFLCLYFLTCSLTVLTSFFSFNHNKLTSNYTWLCKSYTWVLKTISVSVIFLDFWPLSSKLLQFTAVIKAGMYSVKL